LKQFDYYLINCVTAVLVEVVFLAVVYLSIFRIE